MSVDFHVGDVLESKDAEYEPGRRIRLVAQEASNYWRGETIANPRRPHTVGKVARFGAQTLRSRWRPVDIPGADS
jgi:hypothetical protein